MIVEYPNFLTPDECSLLIGMGESGDLRLGQTNGTKIGYRKAKVTWFRPDNQFANNIKQKIAELSNVPLENQEGFHFVKYNPNGEYKIHHDGSKRVKTALIYLNDGYKGGETYFPKVDRKINPETGKLIIWNNYNNDGTIIRESEHAGLPVEFGTKYIAVIWIRNHKFEK
jgi:prolyl 4-hydroxylase